MLCRLTDIVTLTAFTYESLRAELEQWRAEFVTRNGSKPRAEDIKAAGTDTGMTSMHCSCQVMVGTATTLGKDASIIADALQHWFVRKSWTQRYSAEV
jgi:hypothetical protein